MSGSSNGDFTGDGSCGLDFKEEMINQNLKSGQLAVNSSLKRSREPGESQSTLGHFLIWKRMVIFTCHTVRIHLHSVIRSTGKGSVRPSTWNIGLSDLELVNQE